MQKIHRQFLLLLLIIFSVFSLTTDAQLTNFNQLIVTRFAKQWINSPQEKAYLQTDKPYYSAGEEIWFKGYVVNATTHIPKTLSKYLYVELIDKSNAIISRVKIRKDSLGFSGCIKLKPELKAGSYLLRAYTYWMQNATSDFFFSKILNIGNPIDDFIASQINFSTTTNGKIEATIKFNDVVKNPISGKSVDVYQNWNNPQNKKNTLITNKEGKINLQLLIDTINHTTKFLEVSINDPSFKYSNRFYLPEFKSDFDLQFFPESGNAISNFLQVIAFKAIGSDGLSVEVTGKIYSGSNKEVADLNTLTKGMGKFSIEMRPGETYYAKVKSKTGIEKQFNLPKPITQGVGIHIVHNRGKILFQLINNTPTPNSKLYLLVHSRGKVFVIHKLNTSEGQVADSFLPSGIASFSVIDSIGNTYCERLFFVRNLNLPTIQMVADKSVYGNRELVDLNLKVYSALGKPCVGNYSISVTDNHSVKLDSLSDNILSNLLLTSDIKGYVEDPSCYFTKNINLDNEKLDLLMLTQAWRRFKTSDVVNGKYTDQPYYMEAGQTLSGKVMTIFNKPSKKCGLIVISQSNSKIILAQTDSLGRYLIDGIEYPDSSTFILKAKKEKTFGDVEIIPDVDHFPKASVFIPYKNVENSIASTEYLKQSREKYFTDGGMRVVNLNAVTVKAAKINKEAPSYYYSGMEDNKFTSEKLDNFPGMSIFDILLMIPGIQVSGTQVSIRGSQSPPLFLIDDIESRSIDDITYLTTNDIEEISVFKGSNASIFGSRGSAGVIAIALKKGVVQKSEAPISLITVTPLGYQKPSQFYVPKYEVDSIRLNGKSDLRTTIYWNPKLVSDNNGAVNVKFYTADTPNNYDIVLEGITNTGEICRYVGILKREDKK
jgi:hypothetical protein